MMCPCRFINGDKCTTLLGDVDNEGGYEWVGQWVYEKCLYLLLNFAWTESCSKKIKSISITQKREYDKYSLNSINNKLIVDIRMVMEWRLFQYLKLLVSGHPIKCSTVWLSVSLSEKLMLTTIAYLTM